MFSSSSSGEYVIGQTGTRISISGRFGGDTMRMLYEITNNYPPDNYDVGRVIEVEDYDDGYFYYFQVRQE